MLGAVMETVEESTEIIETVEETVTQYVGYDYTEQLSAISDKLDLLLAKLDYIEEHWEVFFQFMYESLKGLSLIQGIMIFMLLCFVFFLVVRLFKLFF